jgi:hypothetical protein
VAGTRFIPVVTMLAAVLANAGAGQSLGELAQREQERRGKDAPKRPVPSFTDADLAARHGAAVEAASPSPAPSSSPAEKPPSVPAGDKPPSVPAGDKASPPPAEDESAVRQRQEAKWRARFEEARERIRVAEAGAWRTVIETVFVSGIPVQQAVRKFEETGELRGAKAALADLEEEFRRTGLPAGWAR